MRRVIDDTVYEEFSEKIQDVMNNIDVKTQGDENRYGTRAISTAKIKEIVLENVKNIKYGKYMNTTGIGNNYSCELIYTGDPKEEQIFGIIHITDDMYGSQHCWVSDYDNVRRTKSVVL